MDSSSSCFGGHLRSLDTGNCQTLPMDMTAQAEPQHISAGPCSPFQALSQCQYNADRACSLPESVAQHRSLAPLPDLCDALEDVSGLTEPTASSLSCTTPNSYPAMSSSSIDRYPSAPASQTQSLFATLASAASADPLPSPSLSPPVTSPSKPAVPTEAEHAGNMATSPHMEVKMSLNVAPAAFSHPIRVNKAFLPAFQVCPAYLSALTKRYCMHKQCRFNRQHVFVTEFATSMHSACWCCCAANSMNMPVDVSAMPPACSQTAHVCEKMKLEMYGDALHRHILECYDP